MTVVTLEEDLGRPMSAADAERDLGILRSTVATWHARRDRTGLFPMGKDARGYPLFWEVDLIALSLKLQIRDEEGQRLYVMSDLQQLESPGPLARPRGQSATNPRSHRRASS